jgi:hypothetical protein
MTLETTAADQQQDLDLSGVTEPNPNTSEGDSGSGKPPTTTPEPEPQEGQPPSTPGQEEELPPAAVYTPKEKFTAMNKEFEVPALLKGVMKDPASEKEVLDLLEKAYAVDDMKEKIPLARQERDQYKAELNNITHQIGDLRTTFQKGDINLFLEKLAIPKEKMLQWAVEELNYSQLPEDQKKQIDDHRDAQRRADLASQQVGYYEQQLFEQARQAKQALLQVSLARSEVKTFADQFDARVGRPGAFFEEIRATGENEWNASQGKIDLTPEQAIGKVMAKWKPFIQAQPAQPQGAPQVKVVQSTQTPTIPNIQGKSQSPMKAMPRSIEDLKKLRDQALNEAI